MNGFHIGIPTYGLPHRRLIGVSLNSFAYFSKMHFGFTLGNLVVKSGIGLYFGKTYTLSANPCVTPQTRSYPPRRMTLKRLTMRTNLAMRSLMFCTVHTDRLVQKAEIASACNASENDFGVISSQAQSIRVPEYCQRKQWWRYIQSPFM